MAAATAGIPPPIQTVVRARSETEAAWMLAEGREGTRAICGGTDLMLQVDRRRLSPTGLVDIRRAQMDRLQLGEDAIVIGAAATASQLMRWKELQPVAAGLWEAAATLSVPTIRNMASLGGNLANASPAADMVPPVMAMGGEVEVRRGDDRRRIPVTELATGPGRTQLTRSDLLTRVFVPRWKENAFHHFSKLGFRDAQIIAVVSLAFSCEMEGDTVSRVGIALGSVAATVKRARAVEAFLLGKRLTREVAQEAVRLLGEDISPIDDVRSEARFRLQVARNYLADCLARAFVHSTGENAAGLSSRPALRVLKDPAPRPPSLQAARTDALAIAQTPSPKLRIVPTSSSAYVVRGGGGVDSTASPTGKSRSAKEGASNMAARKKTAKKKTTKKAAKKAGKKKAAKKATKKKAKKKATKKKAKKKVAKKKATKKAGKKKAAKKAGKKKAKKKAAKKAGKKAGKKKARKKAAKTAA